MSLATTIGAGALLGTVLAVGVYNVVSPADTVPASVGVAPTYAPVPTPTVTEQAEDCVDPAVLEDDECVVHVPGPTITVAPATGPSTREAGATLVGRGYGNDSRGEEHGDDDSDGEEYGDDDSQDEYEHEDQDHEDDEHEGVEDEEHEDGEPGDD